MNLALLKDFLDACHTAHKIEELMPPLPQGLKPRHIHVLDVVAQLQQTQPVVRVSDISKKLQVTTPSITKLINELVAFHTLVKEQDHQDKRVFTLKLAPLGQHYYELYVQKYHGWLQKQLASLDEAEIATTVRLLTQAYAIMKQEQPKL